MRQAKRDPEELLPLSLSVFHILLSLADQERHGYGIMKRRLPDRRQSPLGPWHSLRKHQTSHRRRPHRKITGTARS